MEKCQICGKEDADLRTLKLRYFYEFLEISEKLKPSSDGFYSILTCKSCRGGFIGLLRRWTNGEFISPGPDDDPDRNIPVRIDGATVMMNTDEWEAHCEKIGQPGEQPVRLA